MCIARNPYKPEKKNYTIDELISLISLFDVRKIIKFYYMFLCSRRNVSENRDIFMFNDYHCIIRNSIRDSSGRLFLTILYKFKIDDGIINIDSYEINIQDYHYNGKAKTSITSKIYKDNNIYKHKLSKFLYQTEESIIVVKNLNCKCVYLTDRNKNLHRCYLLKEGVSIPKHRDFLHNLINNHENFKQFYDQFYKN